MTIWFTVQIISQLIITVDKLYNIVDPPTKSAFGELTQD